MIKIYKLLLLGLLTNYLYASYNEDILNCRKAEQYSTEDYICQSYSFKELATNEYYSYKELIELKPNEIDRIKKEKDTWLNNDLNSCKIKNQEKYKQSLVEEKKYIDELKTTIKDEEILKKDIYLALKIKELKEKKQNKDFYNDINTNKCLQTQYNKRDMYYVKENIDLITENHTFSVSNKPITQMTEEELEKFKNEISTIDYYIEDKIAITNCKIGYKTLAGKINEGFSALCEVMKENKKIEMNLCFNMADLYYSEEKNKTSSEKEEKINLIENLIIKCYGG